MSDTTISTITSYSTDLKMDYANYATLQVLEKELDRLKEERQARRLSMFADIQPRISSSTPPPQFKRRHSTSPEVSVSIEHTKNEQKEEFIGNSDSSVCSSSSSTTSSNSDTDSIIMEDEPQLQPNQYISNNSNNVQQHEYEKQITKENSYQSSTVPNITTITATTTTTTIPTSICEKKNDDEETQESTLSSTKVTTKKNDKISMVSTLMQNYSKKLESSQSTPTKQIATNNKTIKELTNSFLKKDEEKETNTKKSKPFHREKKPHLRIQTMFDQQQQQQQQQQPIPEQRQLHKTLLNNKQKNDHENKLLLHAKQNLKKKSITTVSSPSLSSSFVPSSSKSASSILYKPKNDKKENNNDISIKGKRIQPSQSTNISTTATNHKRENKPRPLSDAFIGVKGLSKKFDSTNNEQSTSPPRIRRDSKPLLSPASQSVSRDRKISSSKRPASVNALSQLFSSSPCTENTFNQSTKKSLSKLRQSKPLPPIHFGQQQKETRQQEPKQQQHQNKEKKKMIMIKKNMSLPSRNNSMKIESHRLYHKTMPSIPINNSNTRPPIVEFPNPLPVYTPLLTHLATENQEQEEEEQEKQIQKQLPTPALEQEIKVPSSIKAPVSIPEESVKKRVSFSSVITSIPPPSPFSDDEEVENNNNNNNNRRTSSTMSSAHLLSLWQQEHEKERQRRDRTNPPIRKITTASITTNINNNNNSQKNDTSTFWEAFSTEMNNRAGPDLRRIEPKSQLKKQQQPRFIPSTFSNNGEVKEFLPSPIKSSITQETTSSPQKTWINMLQDKLVKKNSMEKLDQPPPKALTNNNNNNIRSLWNDNNKLTSLSRKPVVSFDQPTKTAPLYHPTKTRPKKPSSFRKSQNMHHHYPLRNNIVGPEVSIPPTAVQKSWHRNY
ncbi:hypothetical protein INT45_012843 [Circinella minor]|uniref:Uncharacterized protein n=1 Tax=Circinella minor TaxID=1195481 RepID=A0A8H7S4D9_9FUNG|nr:hypothetical protein INT45_012843 [Circinella minor]